METIIIQIGLPIVSNLVIVAYAFGRVSMEIKSMQDDILEIKRSMEVLPKLQSRVSAIEAVEEYKKNEQS